VTSWTALKLKTLALKMALSRKWKQATDWERIFEKCLSDEGLVSKIYKELFKCNNNNTN
jgi:hypothetical protein